MPGHSQRRAGYDFVGVSNIDQQVHSFEEHAVSITAHHGIYR
jgi:hypothetical protein